MARSVIYEVEDVIQLQPEGTDKFLSFREVFGECGVCAICYFDIMHLSYIWWFVSF